MKKINLIIFLIFVNSMSQEPVKYKEDTKKELREITDELSKVVEELQEISKAEKELVELRKQEAERVEQATKLKEKIEVKEEPKKPTCKEKCDAENRDCIAKRDQSNSMVNCEGQYCSCINKCPGSHAKC